MRQSNRIENYGDIFEQLKIELQEAEINTDSALQYGYIPDGLHTRLASIRLLIARITSKREQLSQED